MYRTLIKQAIVAMAGAAIASGALFWAGWRSHTRITAMVSKAQADVLVPYCIASSKADPWRYQDFERIKALPVESRTKVVERAGWATPLGQKLPNPILAEACLRALELK